VEFLSNFRKSKPPAQTSIPLLKTLWRRFWSKAGRFDESIVLKGVESEVRL